jgi:hypothetical protein
VRSPAPLDLALSLGVLDAAAACPLEHISPALSLKVAPGPQPFF